MRCALGVILLMLLGSCVEHKCAVDTYVADVFDNNFSVVRNLQPDKALTGEEYIAIFFLEEISGIKSNVNYGDVSYYLSQEDIRLDITNWEAWYESNKCVLTPELVRATEKEIDESTSWIEKE